MQEFYLEGKRCGEQFHEYVKQALELPDYYGHNLDALYDCLTDIGESCRIHIADSDQIRSEILTVFQDAADENEHIELIYG